MIRRVADGVVDLGLSRPGRPEVEENNGFPFSWVRLLADKETCMMESAAELSHTKHSLSLLPMNDFRKSRLRKTAEGKK